MKYSLAERRVVTKGDFWIAPNATVIGAVVLENNASLWFNVVVRGDNDVITIGEHVLTFSLGEPGDAEEEPEQDSDPIGTRIFSARELSDIKTKPAIDASELARQNRVLGVLSLRRRVLSAEY